MNVCFLAFILNLALGSFEQSIQTLLPEVETLIQHQEFLDAEELVLKKIDLEENVQRKADLLALLSCIYVKDQKEEAAFQTYLKAIQSIQVPTLSKRTDNEGALFEKYLALYLKTPQPTVQQSEEFAKEILPHIEKHPDYYSLRLLYACTFANRKLYEEFFCNFFYSYKHCQDCYLIPRTLAILNLKLFERARTCEEKEVFRKQVVQHLEQALQLYDKDSTVYKLL